MYSYDQAKWPNFTWDSERLSALLTEIRYRQGKRPQHKSAVA
ncbi:DUF4172 domain-containing protein [Sediminibacterium soli]|nr:DUF4172 domain-containing protein [Sediminibacterium soli]